MQESDFVTTRHESRCGREVGEMIEQEWVENFVGTLEECRRRARAARDATAGLTTSQLEACAAAGGVKALLEAATNARIVFRTLLTVTEAIAESAGVDWEHAGHDTVLDDLAAALAPFAQEPGAEGEA
jgi:hypothetical protein